MKTEKPTDIASLKLGVSNQLIEPETGEDNRLLSVQMARQASAQICIATRHLDASIYDTDDFVDAIKQLVTRGGRATVKILIKDAAPILRRGHRLVTLAQRVTSFIEIRRPGPQHESFNKAYYLVDRCGYIDRTFSDRFEASANFNDPRTVRALCDSFEDMWHAAEPEVNLRRLS